MTGAVSWMGGAQLARNSLNAVLSDGNTVANYRPGVGVTGTLNASAWANQIGAAGSLAQATGGSQPIVLAWSGTNYLWCASGDHDNTCISGTNVAFDGLTDVTIVVKCASDNWAAAGADHIMAINLGGGARDISFLLLNDRLAANFTTDQTDKTKSSTAATGFAAGSTNWVATTRKSSDGATNFYSGTTEAGLALLGTAATGQTGALGSGTDGVRTGWYALTNSEEFNGKIFQVKVYSGLVTNFATGAGGTLLYYQNFESIAEGATSFVADGTLGLTTTITQSGTLPFQIVGSPQLLFDGAADFLQIAFTANQPMTRYSVIKQTTWTIAEALMDGAAGGVASTALLSQSTTTPNITIFAGSALADNGNLAVKAFGVVTEVYNGVSSSLKVNATTTTTGDAGAGNSDGLTVGANGIAVTAIFSNIQVKEIIVRTVADTAAVQASIQAKLKQIYGTP